MTHPETFHLLGPADQKGLSVLRKSVHLAVIGTTALMSAGAAWAQAGDVVIMRKVMGSRSVTAPVTTPTPTPAPTPTPTPASVTWHVDTHVSGTTFYFQGDGNMVLYRPCPTGCGAVDAVWSSDTWGNTRAYYVLDDVGQLTVYNQDRSPNIIFRSQGGTSSYLSPTRR